MDQLEISVTAFKAKCLGLFKDLEQHRYSKAVITRRGKPIAELTPPEREVPARTDGVLVSPVSAWEIGMLASRAHTRARLDPSLWIWLDDVLRLPGVRLTALAPHAAIESAFLPGELPRDPVDRRLIATARGLGAPLVTRDAPILAYARQGHLDVIPC